MKQVMKQMMKLNNKVLFIICEGASDDVTIHNPLVNYLSLDNKMIKVVTTKGDIAYNKNITSKNCKSYIKRIVDDFKEKMFLYSSDFISIIHLVDTDGAFMEEENIIEEGLGTKNTFVNDTLYTASKKSMTKRFKQKKEVYEELLKIPSISKIPYYKFFFSRNLEHALYDLPNASLQEKITLSKSFDLKYKMDKIGFSEILKSILFEVPLDYMESWEYIFKDNNSVKRCSNVFLLLELLDE